VSDKTIDMIGHKLRLIRENKGLSREYLAQIISVDERTYEKIENDKRDLRLSELELIAEALEVNKEDLWLREPSLTFENCQNIGGAFSGSTVTYNNLEELKSLFNEQMQLLQVQLDKKDQQIKALNQQLSELMHKLK